MFTSIIIWLHCTSKYKKGASNTSTDEKINLFQTHDYNASVIDITQKMVSRDVLLNTI